MNVAAWQQIVLMPTWQNLGPKKRHPLILLRHVTPRSRPRYRTGTFHVLLTFHYCPGPNNMLSPGVIGGKRPASLLWSSVKTRFCFIFDISPGNWWQLILILGGKLIDMNDGCNLDLDWIICFETNWERNHILNELSPPFSFIFS